jgi:hypothetical protein
MIIHSIFTSFYTLFIVNSGVPPYLAGCQVARSSAEAAMELAGIIA